MLTKKVKPIIVSMAIWQLRADIISHVLLTQSSLSQPITGSIGIFAIIPNLQKLFNDKLGLTFDGVKTGKYADLGDISRPLSLKKKLSCKIVLTVAITILPKQLLKAPQNTGLY